VIPRLIQPQLTKQLRAGGKAVVLYGARQVGKTTLVRHVLSELPYRTLTVNADEAEFAEVLSSRSLRQLRGLTADYEALFVDEAQRIPEIGVNLKLLVDNMPDLRLIVTGSSSLNLASKIQEPLTGRAWVHTLYPISMAELRTEMNEFELTRTLNERLVFGSYPEVLTLPGNESRQAYLRTLAASYLFKDLLEIGGIRYSTKLRQLVRLLAFQIGQQVSLSELGTQLGMSKDTVTAYIDLLEQAFVVFRMTGFSRNLRKEVSKMDKIYFWDLGVRNVLIDNLKPVSERDDAGRLWENFVISERRKVLSYDGALASVYFWRTHTGAELDVVEERDGMLHGYETKWGQAKARAPQSFLDAYPGATFDIIRPGDLSYLLRVSGLTDHTLGSAA
jgi:predicted AAA+ superfamily ATPase